MRPIRTKTEAKQNAQAYANYISMPTVAVWDGFYDMYRITTQHNFDNQVEHWVATINHEPMHFVPIG